VQTWLQTHEIVVSIPQFHLDNDLVNHLYSDEVLDEQDNQEINPDKAVKFF